MKAGGFVFENKNEPIAKRNLAITLSMNPSFERIPSGHIGLAKWYPDIKRKLAAKAIVKASKASKK